MHTSWLPPVTYPVALLNGVVYIPDFQHEMPAGPLADIRAYIHADMRRRHLAKQAQPFASSMISIARTYPEADIMIVSTEGWENPGPLAVEPEE